MKIWLIYMFMAGFPVQVPNSPGFQTRADCLAALSILQQRRPVFHIECVEDDDDNL